MSASNPLERFADAEDAKAELQRIEMRLNLPSSSMAGIIQILGILGVLGSLLLMADSFAFGLSSAMASLFVIALGRIYQIVFDIRTIALKRADRENLNA
ncbi:hypothetical protein [Altererythrobacter sp. GH1-8]|uniref:hypothetical protein n=1 Tax=Altererythrobacter sp. GH1-8 TaxID=3349333 RepID=UPI00374CED1E